MGQIKKITVKGFKSIRELDGLELRPLNIIVGANGAGKSNLIQIFKMLIAMTKGAFQEFIETNGGADAFPFNGPKATNQIGVEFDFTSNSVQSSGSNYYRFWLKSTASEKFLIDEERKNKDFNWKSYGSPSYESRLSEQKNESSWDGQWHGVGYFVYEAISNWQVYHFHDTSLTVPMRRSEIVQDNERLRGDAANIAPFLLKLKNTSKNEYQKIVDALRLVIPFFDDFVLEPYKQGEAEKVKLSWKQQGSDYPFQPYHFSDGSIRFICLATALLQPCPPSTIIIDEPELGLHPEAIDLLAELIKLASNQTQVIVATQSPLLLNSFSVDDIIVAKRTAGASTFNRLKSDDYAVWFDDYTVGELWTKNVIQGGTSHE